MNKNNEIIDKFVDAYFEEPDKTLKEIFKEYTEGFSEDKTKEYTFIEAWGKSIDDSNVIITSKSSGYSYKIDKFAKGDKLKFYSSVISTWRQCTHVLPEEMFDAWYVTRELKL